MACAIQPHHLAGPTGGADDTEHPLVPPEIADDHLVGQATKDLIGQDNGRDHRLSIAAHWISHGQDGWDHVARVPATG